MSAKVQGNDCGICFLLPVFCSCFLNASGSIRNADRLCLMRAAILDMTTYQHEWQVLEQNQRTEGEEGGSNNITSCFMEEKVFKFSLQL